jgi:hypothetical protein
VRLSEFAATNVPGAGGNGGNVGRLRSGRQIPNPTAPATAARYSTAPSVVLSLCSATCAQMASRNTPTRSTTGAARRRAPITAPAATSRSMTVPAIPAVWRWLCNQLCELAPVSRSHSKNGVRLPRMRSSRASSRTPISMTAV